MHEVGGCQWFEATRVFVFQPATDFSRLAIKAQAKRAKREPKIKIHVQNRKP